MIIDTLNNISVARVAFYEAEKKAAFDYFPFGMIARMNDGSGKYRFGFNGKENDNEVKGGIGSQQDYGMRVYDPRIGRFLSVDPLTRSFPWNSPYSFAENDVIRSIDLDGLEKYELSSWDPGLNAVNATREERASYGKTAGKVSLYGGYRAAQAWTIIFMPAVGAPWLLSELSGAPVNPGPQTVLSSATTRALTEAEITMQEASSLAKSKLPQTANAGGTVLSQETKVGTLVNSSEQTVAATSSIEVSASSPGVVSVARRTPKQSEELLTPRGFGIVEQASFKSGQWVGSNVKGSVKPESFDWFQYIGHEVKNFTYNARSGGFSESSINGLVDQIIARQSHLPAGSTQNIIIDIAGQNVPLVKQLKIKSDIMTRANVPGLTIQYVTQ